jgi:hypothetical protein
MTDRLDRPPSLDDAERMYKDQLADLQMEFQRQAQPILSMLARIEGMKPPRPVWIGGQWVIINKGNAVDSTVESLPDRMHRLERERDQALHLLRMVRGASEPWITQMIDKLLKEMKP